MFERPNVQTCERMKDRLLARIWRKPAALAALAIGALALLAFLAVADIVFNQRPLLQVDTEVVTFLRRYITRRGTVIMDFVSALADPVSPVVGVAAGLLLAYRRRWADLALLVAAAAGGLFLNWWLKQVYDAVRPPDYDPLDLGFTWGFPSGHAIAAIVVYGALGMLLWPRVASRRRRIAAELAIAGLIGLIGFSRLYVHDHYLGDVLAGLAIGGAWLALCTALWLAYRE